MKNDCQYCAKEFPRKELVYSYFPMCLPNMEYEKRIEELGREEWFLLIDNEDISKELREELDNLAFYDQLLSTLGKGFVCTPCLEKENELYAQMDKLKFEK